MISNTDKTALLKICLDAGAAIMDIYGKADLGIEHKGDDSPLTLADKAANEVICAGLADLEQVYPIISEENKAIAYADRQHYDYVWMVDPLDGTKEFIKRNGEFTVNIALLHGGEPVAGFVYAPALDELYYAIRGEGSYQVIDGTEVRLSASCYSRTEAGLRVVGSRSHLNAETQAFVDALNQAEIVAKGSSLKFLLIAKGDADLYPRLAPTMEWDTAAADIILREAGGQVVQADSGEPMVYNKEDLLNPFFIAKGREA